MSAHSKMWQKKVKKFLTNEKLPTSGPAKRPEIIEIVLKEAYGSDADVYNLYNYGDEGLTYFNALAPHYDAHCFFPEVEAGVMAIIAAQIQKFNPHIVLDAGCTTGIATVFFAEQFPNISFLASDFSKGMLTVTEERIKKRGISNIHTIHAEHSILIDYVDPNSLNMVITMGSASPLFHDSFEDFSSVLEEIMTPGGIYISVTPPAEISPRILAEKLEKLGFAPEGEIKLLSWKHGALAYIFTLRKM